MVFISLEDVVAPSCSTTGSDTFKQASPAAFQATTRVVVTPGSLAKQDLHTTRAGLFQLGSKQGVGPQHFVLYVSDRVMGQRWVLDKTLSDHALLHKGVRRAVGSCCKSSCCAKLRRLAKAAPSVSSRRMWGLNSHTQDQCSAFQEYLNSLMRAVLRCDPQCESMHKTRDLLEEFLEIATRRTEAVDRAIHNASSVPSSTAPEDPLHRSCSDASDDSSECPICCGDLADDRTLRLPCGHNYHSGCVQVWLKLQHTCPVCRLQVDLSC